MRTKKGIALINPKTILLLLIVFFVLVFFNVGGLRDKLGISTSSIFSSEKYFSEKTTEKETTYYETDTEYIRTNLCNLFQPIIISGDSVNQCNLNGGDWYCEDDFVGCRDMINPVIDCSGPVAQYAMYECQSVGAVYRCTPTNAYCYYD